MKTLIDYLKAQLYCDNSKHFQKAIDKEKQLTELNNIILNLEIQLHEAKKCELLTNIYNN